MINSQRWLAALLLAALSLARPTLAEDAAAVEVIRVGVADLSEELVLSGTVTALHRADLSPRVGGLVQTLAAEAGDRVRAGQTLVELDPTLARLALQRSDAELAEAHARLREAQRLRAEARSLVDRKFLPETRLAAAEAEVELAAASLARLEAMRREASERLARHRVTAPFDGVIAQRHANLGEWVDTGDALFELVATDALRVDVAVPQEHFPRIGASAPVSIRTDGQSGEQLAGRVAARVPISDPAARTFLVRVAPEQPSSALAPGMSAQVVFRMTLQAQGLSVPRDALMRRPDGTVDVWIASAGTDGQLKATRRAVRLGRSLARQVEIIEGLEAGQQVIVRGNERLREGQLLSVASPPGDAPGAR